MLTDPIFEDRPAQSYAYIDFTVTMQEMQKPAAEGFPALFGWLAKHGVTPVGAAFYNYRRIDMARTLDVEAGVPVERMGEGDETVRFGTLPAGRYVVVTHTGHFDGLYDATSKLIGWARDNGVQWDMEARPDGDHFACRLEIYESDPDEEPDPAKWVTQLAFKVKG